MQITSFSIYRYKLPLTAPLRFPMRRLYRREGLLLRVAEKDGSVGWGEVAPLPGFSHERLQLATRQAFKLKRVMTGREIDDDADVNGIIEAVVEEMDLVPSVRFGFELAVWSLYAEVREQSLAHMLTPTPRPTVAVNGLLAGEREEVLKAAARMREDGFHTAKLKVGGPDVNEDIALVEATSEVLGPGIALRLDANRAWDLDEAEAFVKGVNGVRFEFIEEPLYDPSELPAFVEATGVPVALDESTSDIDIEALAAHDYATAVILKPTLLGGLTYVRRLAEAVSAHGMRPIVSGAYEGGIGTIGLVTLAACIGEEDVPVGVDTYRRLEKDVVRPRIKMNGGRVDVASMLGTKRTLNGHMLREV